MASPPSRCDLHPAVTHPDITRSTLASPPHHHPLDVSSLTVTSSSWCHPPWNHASHTGSTAPPSPPRRHLHLSVTYLLLTPSSWSLQHHPPILGITSTSVPPPSCCHLALSANHPNITPPILASPPLPPPSLSPPSPYLPATVGLLHQLQEALDLSRCWRGEVRHTESVELQRGAAAVMWGGPFRQ